MGNAQQVGALLGKKDFPYEIEDMYAETFLWKIHKGRRKSDAEPVTIFKFDFDQSTHPDKIELAKGSLKRLRAIRHPSVLTFLDGVELSNTIFIVTEYAIPLSVELQNLRIQSGVLDSISWGLYQVAKVLTFLHSNSLYHCNVNMESVFVDAAGDWKIGELGFLTSFQSQGVVNPSEAAYGVPVKRFFNFISQKHRSGEMSSQRWDIIESAPAKIDSWGFACLIYEIFEGELSYADDLKKVSLQKIPKTLRVAYDQLTDKNPKNRMELARALENPYFSNNTIETQLFLENLTLKDPVTLETFLNRLPEIIPNLAKNNLKNKVLPSLIQLIKFGTSGQKAIVPVMKIGTVLGEDDYKQSFLPKVLDLFEIADRTIRVNLLRNIDHMVMYLTQEQAENIYVHVSKGFRDSAPIMREMTVKSMIPLVPKLKEDTIDNSVVRFLWALQGDRENAIRTNTVIAFGKLAPYLSDATRKKVLLAAFVRSLKDPFIHSRLSALKALLTTKSYYSLHEVAVKGLPFVVSLTVDPEKQVRDFAFQVLNELLRSISDASEQPNFNEIIGVEKAHAQPNTDTSQGETNNSDYFSWAVKSIKTKVMGDDHAPSVGHSNPTTPSVISQGSTSNYGTTTNTSDKNVGSTQIYKPMVPSSSTPQKTTPISNDPFNLSGQNPQIVPKSQPVKKTTQPNKPIKQPSKASNDTLDDFFGFDDDLPMDASGSMTPNVNNEISDDWDSWDMDNQFAPTVSSVKNNPPKTSTTNQPSKPSVGGSASSNLQLKPAAKKPTNTLEDDFFGSLEPKKATTSTATLKPTSSVSNKPLQPTKATTNQNQPNTSKQPQQQKDPWANDNWEEW